MNKKRLIVIGISTLLIGAAVIGAFYFGYKQGLKNPEFIIVKGVSNTSSQEKNVDFNLFWQSWETLKEKYVDADKITNQDLLYGAISGILSATGDPHTNFFPPKQAKGFNEEISGEFGGIGIEIGVRQNQLTVIAPLKNTPAEKAGIKAGDKILKINGESTIGVTAEEAVNVIRGEKETKVILTIGRDEWSEPKDIELIRDIIQVPTLDWKIINENGKEISRNGILYVQLYNFYEKAPFLFYQMAIQSAFLNPQGIILDLRNNPGGYLDAAVNIAGWFLEKGAVVVKEKFKSGDAQIFTANGTKFYKDIPVVVLINEGSASASEILAGALRDNRHIKLVGKKSFGKGSVQEVIELKDNSLLKITIAHWFTPNNTLIEKEGLTPDYEVNLTEDDIKNKKDPQLGKAIELVETELRR